MEAFGKATTCHFAWQITNEQGANNAPESGITQHGSPQCIVREYFYQYECSLLENIGFPKSAWINACPFPVKYAQPHVFAVLVHVYNKIRSLSSLSLNNTVILATLTLMSFSEAAAQAIVEDQPGHRFPTWNQFQPVRSKYKNRDVVSKLRDSSCDHHGKVVIWHGSLQHTTEDWCLYGEFLWNLSFRWQSN